MATSESVPLATAIPNSVATIPIAKATPRHSAIVRITHWLITLAFLALLVTGIEILISHPRFYWGETGNVQMKPLFILHIPSSRNWCRQATATSYPIKTAGAAPYTSKPHGSPC